MNPFNPNLNDALVIAQMAAREQAAANRRAAIAAGYSPLTVRKVITGSRSLVEASAAALNTYRVAAGQKGLRALRSVTRRRLEPGTRPLDETGSP